MTPTSRIGLRVDSTRGVPVLHVPQAATDGEYAYFSEVGEDTVPWHVRRAVAGAMLFAQGDLDLPPLTVRWFDLREHANDPHVFRVPGGHGTYGAEARVYHAEPTVVWMRRSLTPARAAPVALHECRHTRQMLDGYAGPDECGPDSPAEAEAWAYVAEHRQLAGRFGDPAGGTIRPKRRKA